MLTKFFLLLFFPSFLFAQKTIDVGRQNINLVGSNLFYTVNGTPFSPNKYVRVVAGSPFFDEQWMKGMAILGNGGSVKTDSVKLDLLSNELVYQDSTGTELIATTPVKQLTLTDNSGKEYVFVNAAVANIPGNGVRNGWYQVLESGTATLYKLNKKTISETKNFNSATGEQTIADRNLYFIAITNEFISVKKPTNIPAVLSDKKSELDQFISINKINGKKESDFTEIVAKYNLLAITR